MQEDHIQHDEKKSFLEQEARRTGFDAFVLTDLSGNVLNTTLDEPINISDRDYFKLALTGTENVRKESCFVGAIQKVCQFATLRTAPCLAQTSHEYIYNLLIHGFFEY
ncbi:hypothetical protein P4V43_24730 [Brevibacillus fortis]|uniref:hypothetical protein n=1 Tax=Brevibacillus fortis TaxID=2126352 RepID=UPI002E20E583|nr:hypothetical protein [Brevibacillus fortis]